MMAILKKKTVEVKPEHKILEANIHVEAQQAHFTKMVEEVQFAIDNRSDAVIELRKEADSLQAQLDNKRQLIEHAVNQNVADIAFIKRLNEMMGK